MNIELARFYVLIKGVLRRGIGCLIAHLPYMGYLSKEFCPVEADNVCCTSYFQTH